MALTPQRKAGIIQMEYGSFMRNSGKAKLYKRQNYAYKGQTVTIYEDSGDGESRDKVTAIKLAVKTIRDKNFDLPPNLEIYCVSNIEAQNQAFNKDPGWNHIAKIILGTTALRNGRADAVSGMVNPGFTKGSVTTIHEIGHLLHAHARGDDFHDPAGNLTGAAPAVSGQVSGYAGMNKKEFIAETFAGLMVGRHYSTAVMTEYLALGGPH